MQRGERCAVASRKPRRMMHALAIADLLTAAALAFDRHWGWASGAADVRYADIGVNRLLSEAAYPPPGNR